MKGRQSRGRIDAAMVWTTLLSLAGHLAVLAFFLITPNRDLAAIPLPLESYTVELVDPNELGGNSGPVDLGEALEAELPEIADPGEPAEPESAAEEPAEPEEAVEVEEPAESEEVVEVEEPAEPEEVIEVEEPAEPEEVVEVEEPAEPEEVVEVEEPAGPEEVVEVEEPAEPEEVVEVEEPAEAEEVVGVEEPAAEVAAVEPEEAKPVPPTKRSKAAPSAKPKARPKPTADAQAERDRQIAAAIKRRAERAAKASAEDRIAAAVQRRAQRLAGGGDGSEGPLSVGPGSGSGGAVRGAEYILYKRRMETRIRNAWVWAGRDDTLRSVLRFRISPDGEISDIRTIRSSGDKAYDESAERAVRAANPLGMVPIFYRRDFAEIEMAFHARDVVR